MALSDTALKNLILQNLAANGFTTGGEHSWAEPMADAIAKAVVSHIQDAAVVDDNGADGGGEWSIL